MEKQIISKLGRRSKGNFFYHRVETEAYVKTYICGIRTRKRPVNPCKFIGIKMNEQENNLKTWIEEKINMEYEILESKISKMLENDRLAEIKKQSDIRHILCPAKNAFDKYDEIFAECLKQPKEKLLLLALGPTATVLAYDLYRKGYQAIDVGHIDICYEWKLRGATGKIAVPGKYVNEVPDGRENIEECTDRKYLNSIIAKIS